MTTQGAKPSKHPTHPQLGEVLACLYNQAEEPVRFFYNERGIEIKRRFINRVSEPYNAESDEYYTLELYCSYQNLLDSQYVTSGILQHMQDYRTGYGKIEHYTVNDREKLGIEGQCNWQIAHAKNLIVDQMLCINPTFKFGFKSLRDNKHNGNDARRAMHFYVMEFDETNDTQGRIAMHRDLDTLKALFKVEPMASTPSRKTGHWQFTWALEKPITPATLSIIKEDWATAYNADAGFVPSTLIQNPIHRYFFPVRWNKPEGYGKYAQFLEPSDLLSLGTVPVIDYNSLRPDNWVVPEKKQKALDKAKRNSVKFVDDSLSFSPEGDPYLALPYDDAITLLKTQAINAEVGSRQQIVHAAIRAACKEFRDYDKVVAVGGEVNNLLAEPKTDYFVTNSAKDAMEYWGKAIRMSEAGNKVKTKSGVAKYVLALHEALTLRAGNKKKFFKTLTTYTVIDSSDYEALYDAYVSLLSPKGLVKTSTRLDSKVQKHLDNGKSPDRKYNERLTDAQMLLDAPEVAVVKVTLPEMNLSDRIAAMKLQKQAQTTTQIGATV